MTNYEGRILLSVVEAQEILEFLLLAEISCATDKKQNKCHALAVKLDECINEAILNEE